MMLATPFLDSEAIPFSWLTLRQTVASSRWRGGGILRTYPRGDYSHLFWESGFVRRLPICEAIPFSWLTLRQTVASSRWRGGGILRTYPRGDYSHLFWESGFVRRL